MARLSAMSLRPDVLSARRVLAVQPHPDDNEIGAGALIARLRDQGCDVRYVTVTDGSMGTMDPDMAPAELAGLRRREADAAASLLGVSENRHLGHRDLLDSPMPGLRAELMQEIGEFRPDFVLTCDPWLPYEAHPDHRAVGMAVAEAVSFLQFPHVPGAPKDAPAQPVVAFYGTAQPNVRIPAGPYWQRKWEAVARHQTQFPPDALIQLRAFAESMSQGEEGFFEPFKVLHPFFLHFNPAAVLA